MIIDFAELVRSITLLDLDAFDKATRDLRLAVENMKVKPKVWTREECDGLEIQELIELYATILEQMLTVCQPEVFEAARTNEKAVKESIKGRIYDLEHKLNQIKEISDEA